MEYTRWWPASLGVSALSPKVITYSKNAMPDSLYGIPKNNKPSNTFFDPEAWWLTEWLVICCNCLLQLGYLHFIFFCITEKFVPSGIAHSISLNLYVFVFVCCNLTISIDGFYHNWWDSSLWYLANLQHVQVADFTR